MNLANIYRNNFAMQIQPANAKFNQMLEKLILEAFKFPVSRWLQLRLNFISLTLLYNKIIYIFTVK